MNSSPRLPMRGFLPLLIALLLMPSGLSAQATSTITGSVVNASTLRPIGGALVRIEATGAGALTGANGSFTLEGVPVGEHVVRVTNLGFSSAEQTVTVGAATAVSLDFELRESAIALDGIVVSGTGAPTEQRRLGNTVGSISMSELELEPIQNFSQVLQGRTPGVLSLPSSGHAGEGSRIRIRGNSSLTQSNEPLVYVDGVRMDNSGGSFVGGASAGGSSSRLDDIDPSSIERVEILKGAAAATLYGTEASGGVIQIFTKRGSQGAPQWNVQLGGGLSSIPTNRYEPLADYARTAEDVARIRDYWGIEVAPYQVFEQDLIPRFFGTGVSNSESISVSGGTPTFTYYVSGRHAYANGSWNAPNSWIGEQYDAPADDTDRRLQATANISVMPSDKVSLRFVGLFAQTDHTAPQNNNNVQAPFEMGVSGQIRRSTESNHFGTSTFNTVREGLQITIAEKAQRFSGSSTLHYQPVAELGFDATVGIDAVNTRQASHYPFGWNVDNFTSYYTTGRRNVADRNRTEATVDVKGNWSTEFGDLTSQPVVGGQAFVTETEVMSGFGFDFPGPGLIVTEAGASQTVGENYLRVVNTGLFAQEQIGFRDFAFLTLGGRWDANSAFGDNAGGVFYPKASLSIVPSDMLTWNSDLISTFRIRSALGQAGLQPGAFDQFTTFSPLASPYGPGVAPSNLGNPDLKPEVATEWEIGAELGVLQDRAALEVTYWDRTVNDALIAVQFPVSGGFRGTQLANLGTLDASGVEIGLSGTAIDRGRFSLNLNANAAYLTEVISDMGGAPMTMVGGTYARVRNAHKEGYAPGAYFGAKLQDVALPLDLGANCMEPSREEALDFFSQPREPEEFEVLPVDCGGDILGHYLGKPQPDWQGSFGFDGSMGNFRLSSLFEFMAGVHRYDLTGGFRRSNPALGRNTPGSATVLATMANPASTAEQRLDAALIWAREHRTLSPMSGLNIITRADWMRWRELSLTYLVPRERAGGFGLGNLSLTLGARNIGLWTHSDYRGTDPESSQQGRCSASASGTSGSRCNFEESESWSLPLPRELTFTIRAGF